MRLSFRSLFSLLPVPLRSMAKADRCRQPLNPRPAPVAMRPVLGVDRLAYRIGHFPFASAVEVIQQKGEMT